MEYYQHTLKNGIRIIHKKSEGETSHCGITINAGSRDELEAEHGLAHLLEHAIFKGTKKRKAFHVLNRIDSVGGEINAFTAKEETCFYASFLNHHYERALELLCDITFNSVYPPKEIEKEKDVIIDEINSYLDSPAEQIMDDFEELLFVNHSLGRPILGTEKSVKSLTKNQIIQFTKRQYTSNQIVFSSVGDISFTKVIQLCEKYFSSIKSNTSISKRKKFTHYKPFSKIENKDTFQAHCVIGNICYSSAHKKRTEMFLLNNLLGGPAMNSRLNLAIREKYGFTYNLDSSYTPYSDTGIFTIYLGTDNNHLEKSIYLVNKELKKLKEKKLGTLQLSFAKQQLLGHIALSQESRANLMIGLGKSVTISSKIESMQHTIKKINSITAESLIDIANEVFDSKKMSTLIYKGKEK